jgi:hypothetical protein
LNFLLSQGLKPAFRRGLYTALKRSSSTVLQAALVIQKIYFATVIWKIPLSRLDSQ